MNPDIDCDNLIFGEEINIITDKSFIIKNTYEYNLLLNYYLIQKYDLIKDSHSEQCINDLNNVIIKIYQDIFHVYIF